MSDKPVKTERVRSRTDKSKIYLVHTFEDGAIVCTCAGFEFRKKCAHADFISRRNKVNCK